MYAADKTWHLGDVLIIISGSGVYRHTPRYLDRITPPCSGGAGTLRSSDKVYPQQLKCQDARAKPAPLTHCHNAHRITWNSSLNVNSGRLNRLSNANLARLLEQKISTTYELQ